MELQDIQQAGATTARRTPSAKALTVVPLALETRTHLPTEEAAVHLLRSQQTLRSWASTERGPIRPHRVGVRLMWPVSEIRRVLGV